MNKRNLDSLGRHSLPLAIVFCFFLTGAIALVYQTLWVRMFTIVFGNSSYAVSTVLTAFMAGLALGSWYFGRKIDHNPGKALAYYGFLELGVATFALLFPFALKVADSIHVDVYEHLVGSTYLLALTRFLLAFLILLIPTTLMGGTLPVLSRFFISDRNRVGSGVGGLYAANTLGAVAGCFLAGFYSIGILGVSQTMKWNIISNFGVGAAALLLYVLAGRIHGSPEELPEPETDCSDSPELHLPVNGWIILLCAALAGGTGLAYEVFWTRALVFYINNSVYAFTAMLTTLLLGIAVGGFLFGRIADNRRNLWVWFAAFQLCIGLWNFFIFPVLDPVLHKLADSSKLFEANFWGVPVYVIMAKSALLLLAPTLLMGACFPLLTKLFARYAKGIGRGVGDVYSKNTIGAMAGAFAAGFILIPLLGLQKGIIAIALINVALALIAVSMSGATARRRLISCAAIGATAGICLIITPKDMFFKRHDESWSKLLFYKEDNTATVKVYEMPGRKKSISINGYEVAGAKVSLHEIQKGLGHYPALLHENPQTALVVGFGAGGTCASLNMYGLQTIDLVEIVPSVLKAAAYLTDVNGGILNKPALHPVIDDGRNFVHAINRSYDIISVDSIDPKHAGNGNLYTVEFYKDCLSKLNPDGIMVQWIPYHLLTEQELKIIIKSFVEAFPHYNMWFTPLFNYFILAGSANEFAVDYAWLSEKFSDPLILSDLKQIGLRSPAEFISTFAMDETGILAYLGDDVQVNSFDRPRIEFFRKYDFSTFGELPIDTPSKNIRVVNLGSTREEVQAASAAIEVHRQVARRMVKGTYFFTKEKYVQAARNWQAALALDGRNSAARYMLEMVRKSINQELQVRLARLKERPGNAMLHFEMASFLESINNREEAANSYLKAISLKPDFEQAYNNLGLIYAQTRNYDEALEVFQAALEANPLSLIAAHNLGMVYCMKGDYAKAKQVCRQALAQPPNSVQDDDLRIKIKEILNLAEAAVTKSPAKPS